MRVSVRVSEESRQKACQSVRSKRVYQKTKFTTFAFCVNRKSGTPSCGAAQQDQLGHFEKGLSDSWLINRSNEGTLRKRKIAETKNIANRRLTESTSDRTQIQVYISLKN